jgi:hypothetical protein
MGAKGVKVGVIMGFTVMVIVVVVAHCPAVGVKVYVVVVILFRPGVHIPVYPFREVVGRGVITSPTHTAAAGLKTGVMLGLTVIIKVVVVAH